MEFEQGYEAVKDVEVHWTSPIYFIIKSRISCKDLLMRVQIMNFNLT
jgi:hypothetical protein